MRRRTVLIGTTLTVLIALLAGGSLYAIRSASANQGTKYDLNTLAGKVAAVNGTAGLGIRFSALIQEEADTSDTYVAGATTSPISPTNVLSSPLDGNTIGAPDVTVNQDTAAAPQNETAIAVDPNNPERIVGAANDYVTRTWNCTINGTPCSALGDGYSGTYFSNNGGASWCCASNLDGSSQGTLIPGVDHLSNGPYDAGGDPALAFDSRGNVYYAGLGFDRSAPPNTVTVNKGTFDSAGNLSWGAPTFIDQTTSPSVFNDKEWIAADQSAASPYRDRVYVTFTRFIFNAATGAYVQSPIALAYSTDGGSTFSTPQLISGNVLYGQGSRPVVGPDGAVYVFWDGSTRLAQYDSTYMVKSTDGGVTWSKPLAVGVVADIAGIHNTAFRVNSFPAADAGPGGTLYVAWNTEVKNTADPSTYGSVAAQCAYWLGCDTKTAHSVVVYSSSTDGGAHWTTPTSAFPGFNGATRTVVGDFAAAGLTPSIGPDETLWPGVAISPSGRVYVSSYVADVVSPWQTCAKPATPTAVGRIDCLQLGGYVNNARLDYVVTDLTTGKTQLVTTNPINTRSQFGGGFIGDYTDLAVGSDNTFHALWTDTNNKQAVDWFYGYEFAPDTLINQEDVATASGNW